MSVVLAVVLPVKAVVEDTYDLLFAYKCDCVVFFGFVVSFIALSLVLWSLKTDGKPEVLAQMRSKDTKESVLAVGRRLVLGLILAASFGGGVDRVRRED